jgi:hypothetical protein
MNFLTQKLGYLEPPTVDFSDLLTFATFVNSDVQNNVLCFDSLRVKNATAYMFVVCLMGIFPKVKKTTAMLYALYCLYQSYKRYEALNIRYAVKTYSASCPECTAVKNLGDTAE